MLDIYEMQVFLTAAETGSFSEAGRRLQMSQPAVSMQIKSLEKRLNVELFHRAGRHIRLTEMGQALVPMARGLVNHSIDVRESISLLQGEVVGVLKLACSTSAGKYILPKLIARFVDLYPSVQVVCRVGSRGSALEMLLESEAHLAVTSLREPSKELEYRDFVQDPVILIAPLSHPWAKRTIQVSELIEGKFIRRENTSGTYQTVSQALTNYDMSIQELPLVMVLGNTEAINLAVAEGIGVAFVSQRSAADAIQTGRVAHVHIEGLDMFQQLYMVRRSERTMTTVQGAFWNFVYDPENQHLLENELG